MEQEEHIVVDPNVMLGKPVVSGTRVTVQSVVERIAAGESVADIVESHPALTEESVRAALENHEGRLHNAFTVIGTTGVRIRRVSY